MMRKLKQQRGETLIESMVAMLIAVLSMGLLSSAVIASSKINEANRANDVEFSQELQQAEGLLGTAKDATVEIKFSDGTREEVNVDLYGAEGRFISYDYNRP